MSEHSKRQKVIIDTDPGVDDVLALLLALASGLDVVAITTVHGNVDLFHTTRNVISLFKVIEETSKTVSTDWIKRIVNGQIILAAGEGAPLNADRIISASYFHGRDGLGGVSTQYPRFVPAKGWEASFPSLHQPIQDAISVKGLSLSSKTASDEILDVLRTYDDGEVTIVALGPLTNLSKAITTDYQTFSRVREVIVMGGALQVPGNVTPVAEFNFLGDPESCAHLFSFTSPRPSSTYPGSPDKVAKRLNVTLLPLDTTTKICLSHAAWTEIKQSNDSVLIDWTNHFLSKTFDTSHALYNDLNIERVNLSMHDPGCIWYLLNHESSGWSVIEGEDIRIECDGRWTRGMCVIDTRNREKIQDGQENTGSDHDNWLSLSTGNRVRWVKETPPSASFISLLQTVFS